MRFFVCLDSDGVQMQLAAGHGDVSWQEVQALASKERAYVTSAFEEGWNPLEMEKQTGWGSNDGARRLDSYVKNFVHRLAQAHGFDSTGSGGYNMRKSTLGEYIEVLVNIPGIREYSDFQRKFSGDKVLNLFDFEDTEDEDDIPQFRYIEKLTRPSVSDPIKAMNAILDVKELIERKRNKSSSEESELEKLMKRRKK